jgi:PPP family 3-phenylpropionic acid transporter
MSAPASAWRFSFFYSGAFLALGVVIPFWPLWLESRGLDLVEIGQLLALATWCKMISTPVIGQISDRSGRGKTVLVLLSGASLLCYLAFLPATGFWLLLAIQLLASMAFQALVPLGESRTMQVVLRDGLDYGRVRLWGSFTFMMGTLACGLVVRSAGPNWVLYLAIAALLATLIASAALPSGERARPGGRLLSGFRQLLRLPGFLVFLLVAGLLQGSHALYYGFSTLHWQSAGRSEEHTSELQSH